MSNELKVEMSLSPYSPSPAIMSPNFPMSNEIKMEPAFSSLASSPTGFNYLALSPPSFNNNPSPQPPPIQLLGDGDFSSLFNENHNSNRHSNNSLQQLLQLRDSSNSSMSTEIDLYRKHTGRSCYLLWVNSGEPNY